MSAVWTPESLGQPVPAWQRALERRLRREVQETVRRQQAGLPPDSPPVGPEAVQAAIDTAVVAARREAVRAAQPWPADSPALAARLARDLLGDGPLTELLAMPGVTDVWINRPDLVLYRLANGQVHQADEGFDDNDQVQGLVDRWIRPLDRRLDLAQPYVDARLPGRPRLHAIMPPLTRRYTTVSIRTYAIQPHTLAELVWPADDDAPGLVRLADHRSAWPAASPIPDWGADRRAGTPAVSHRPGMLPPELAAYLAHLVVAGVSVIISGPPDAGKTTFLRALAGSIPPFARTLTMEEDPELDLDLYLPNCVGLRTRAPNTEGKGRVDLRELVRQSIRMAGSVAIVGEVRGPESWDLLKLCQIGTTVMASVHGHSCQDALHRLAELTLEGESRRTWQEALQLVASTVGVVVQLQGPRSTGLGAAVGHHRVVQVYEVLGLTADRAHLRGQDLWVLDPATGELVPTFRPTVSLERIRAAGLAYEPPPVARSEPREEVSG